VTLVYGKDQITSGAGQDIRQATDVAQAMVKVCESSLVVKISLILFHRTGASQSWVPYFMTIGMGPSAQEEWNKLRKRLQGAFGIQ
jgi:hypothetical protein